MKKVVVAVIMLVLLNQLKSSMKCRLTESIIQPNKDSACDYNHVIVRNDHKINVVYAVENLLDDEKLSMNLDGSYRHTFVRDITYILRQSLLSLSVTTSKPYLKYLTVHIFCRSDSASDIAVIQTLIDELHQTSNLIDIQLEIFDINTVTSERKVWGKDKKLEASANYLRFYLADILGKKGIKKMLYVDYDVMFVQSVHSVFYQYANGQNVSLAAATQKQENCWAGKIIHMGDSRLSNSKLRANDPCLVSAAMLINTENWIRQQRTKRIEDLLKANKEKELWTLGSLPPLMIEFAGEWEQLPLGVIADNKGHKEGSSLQQMMAENKNITMLHPSKLRNFVEHSIVWFQVVISAEDDIPIMPHLLAGFKSMNIPSLNFLIILHHKTEEAPQLWEATNITKSFGVFNIIHWIGNYSSEAMHELRSRMRKMANVRNDDWIVHADSDQIHEFPTNDAPFFLKNIVSATGYDSVHGYYIDRVSVDGSLNNITSNKSLSDQFPLACYMSTQVVKLGNNDTRANIPSKLIAFRGYLSENRGGGKLDTKSESNSCSYPVWLKSNHYKWTWAVIRKMELRVEIEKKLPWGYQSSNVLKHIKENNGKINIADDRLKCRKVDNEREISPTTSIALQMCSKYKYKDKDLQRLD